jgi:surfactin synthase thioesterase subunit
MSDPEVIAELRRIGGTPASLLEDRDYLERFVLPVVRADHQIFETHRPGISPIHVPILALGGLNDPHTTPQQLEAWGEQTTSWFETCWVPGDHFFIHSRMADISEEFFRRFSEK